ncbi:MAG TPA: hypothetical protein VNH64_12955, partial [Parvularculaceae bacterium]|nr:hypothetical protein [Parvularculaceae bacterium]
MLTTFGDILNWLAAGLVFPLMLLPLAAMARTKNAVLGTAVWAGLVGGVAGAGALFIMLAPRLAAWAPSAPIPVLLMAGFAAIVVLLFGGPRRATDILAPLLAAITRAAGRTVMWVVLLMALVQFAVVILRYVFGISILAMQESITYMHGSVF